MIDLMKDLEQGSPEWLAARVGRVTASRIADVMAKGKGGEAQTRLNYKWQLVAEVMTGQSQEDRFFSQAMAWGVEQEPFARAAYEIHTGVLVENVGLVAHPSIPRCAASPDGLVGLDGLLEIKCPKTPTHLEYMEKGAIPGHYQLQMLWQMACTGRQWVDFATFDPRLPEELQLFQLFVMRFPRDQARIDAIEAEVQKFWNEIDEIIETLRKRRDGKRTGARF
jgi:putative phage-type endonuclease